MKKDIPSINLLGEGTFRQIDTIKFREPLTPAERKSKTRINEWSAWNAYITSAVLLISGIVFAVISVYFCMSIINNPASSADDKKWAMSYLTLSGGGVIGYLTGKSNTKES
jgi:hypothetical protein